jgi:hypothetical protein
MAGIKTIIGLSFVRIPPELRNEPRICITHLSGPIQANQKQVLAIGFLLVILSSALYQNYLPLLVVATYVLAPLPNAIAGRCSQPDDILGDGNGGGVVDFGRFMTGFLVIMGIGE